MPFDISSGRSSMFYGSCGSSAYLSTSTSMLGLGFSEFRRSADLSATCCRNEEIKLGVFGRNVATGLSLGNNFSKRDRSVQEARVNRSAMELESVSLTIL